jgi:uncharacterized protein GlcG (DUF336 family)
MRAFIESTGGAPVQVKSHPIRFGSGAWTCVVGELEDGSRMVTVASGATAPSLRNTSGSSRRGIERRIMTISLSDATAIVDRAISHADAMGVPMNIAVVDGGGHLIALARMDKAILGSIDIALAKAKTSILVNGPSENLWEYCKPGGPAPATEHTNGGLIPSAGGVADLEHVSPPSARVPAPARARRTGARRLPSARTPRSPVACPPCGAGVGVASGSGTCPPTAADR